MRLAIRSPALRPCADRGVLVGRPQVRQVQPMLPLLPMTPCLITETNRQFGVVVLAAAAEAPDVVPEAPATEAAAAAQPAAEGRRRRRSRRRSGTRKGRGQSSGEATEAKARRPPHPHMELMQVGGLVCGTVARVLDNKGLLVAVEATLGGDGAVTPLPALPEGVAPLSLLLPTSRLTASPVLLLANHFREGDRVVAEVVTAGKRVGGRDGRSRLVRRRVLSTIRLEREPGALLANPTAVFEAAVETVAMRASGQLAEAAPPEAAPEPGSLQSGRVVSVDKAGAVVSLDAHPGWHGLLRRTHLSYARVNSAAELLAEGQAVQAVVHSVVTAQRTVVLDRRELELVPGDYVRAARAGVPYTGADEAYARRGEAKESRPAYRMRNVKIGQVVRGVVTLINGAGDAAQVRLEEAPGRRAVIDLTVQPADGTPLPGLADPVRCIVRSLSTRGVALLEPYSGAQGQEAPLPEPGTLLTGRVARLKSYGAFVDLGGGLVGLLHRENLSGAAPERVDPLACLAVGEQLPVLLSGVDRETGRLELNTKALEPTPGDMLTNRALVAERAPEMAELWRRQQAAAAGGAQ